MRLSGDLHVPCDIPNKARQLSGDGDEAFVLGRLAPRVQLAEAMVNRLIGDKQPAAVPIAFTVTSTYKPEAPLRLSGLLGPVTIVRRAP